ncbi:unnamed protein product [Pleuronectes platessa]|uniref:Uncharacterized protein n=1 Tax=Pleuronectes platessa TaxID=8262 RepID=A0A9N7V762_PLEPL|nr:unnamed protein product [Pleuronectes platessa]
MRDLQRGLLSSLMTQCCLPSLPTSLSLSPPSSLLLPLIRQLHLVSDTFTSQELKVAYILNQENTEFQEEKTKKNHLQEELEDLKAYHHIVCKSHTTNQEKVNTKLQEEMKKKKNVRQKELDKLKTFHCKVCQSHTTNQEKVNTKLQEEKKKKNDFREELEKLPKI